jgi:pyruvate/2-oxoglutarate/acetoin dehydrogenase E1 component
VKTDKKIKAVSLGRFVKGLNPIVDHSSVPVTMAAAEAIFNSASYPFDLRSGQAVERFVL